MFEGNESTAVLLLKERSLKKLEETGMGDVDCNRTILAEILSKMYLTEELMQQDIYNLK